MKRVLVAPLDWGLGHTSRCIPILEELITAGHEVFFAGNKKQIAFINQHHLKVKHLELFGYDVSYSAIFPQWVKVGFQSLRLKKTVAKEHQWLNNIIDQHKIDIVISDNRFGLHSKKAHCIFITHQLNIPSPIFSKSINNINSEFINQFNECWIPDNEKLLLSGDLSAKKDLKIPIRKIGLLSRFSGPAKNDVNYDALLLLSGVEPQRSILEEKLLQYFQKTNLKIALVRGIEDSMSNLPTNISQFNLLNSEQLKDLISQSAVVICRSGYSSIMDLVLLHKKMLLIPTPGQPEQEYLATYLHQHFGIPIIEQQALSKVSIDLSEAKTIEFAFGIKNENLLKEAISNLPK